MFTFTTEDFMKIKELIYSRTGIKFEQKKIYFVKRRILERMKALNINSAKEYYRYLKFRDREGKEFQELINLLTTNETYFFREFNQLRVFGEVLLPEKEKKALEQGEKRLKIWSAGCSTGEEPYTLAIIVMEILENYKEWHIEILASDIDETALARARAGIYGERSVRHVPPSYLKKYFKPFSEKRFAVTDEVKSLVKFKKINLMDTDTMLKQKNFDFIFCRNVLIYFDENSRKEVAKYFYHALKPGGYIFLGHSESMARISSAFKIKRVEDLIVYYKPELG